jgi:hypothetical protein
LGGKEGSIQVRLYNLKARSLCVERWQLHIDLVKARFGLAESSQALHDPRCSPKPIIS